MDPSTASLPDESGTPPASLLLVDDEPGILAALRRLFHPQGYRVRTAEGAAAALEALADEPADVVISDMRMPGMDGAALLGEVRARWPGTQRILLTGHADTDSTVAAINRGEVHRFVTKPWNDGELRALVAEALERKRLREENERLARLARIQNARLAELNGQLEARVASRTAELEQVVAMLDASHREVRDNFLASIRIFSGLIEMRAPSMAGHSRRVAELARTLAQRLGFSPPQLQELVYAALLHDIGKVGLPDALLEKPFTRLDPDERSLVAKHPAKGQHALMEIGPLKGAAELIRHHHELYDGSGFPDGLSGLAIPIAARVLTVVNDYDALLAGTLVGRPLKAAEALAYLGANRGRRYDPAIVDGFLDVQAGSARAGAAPVDVAFRVLDLRPGMVLARDLHHRDGYLLLARGFTVTEAVIEQLHGLERAEGFSLSVHVTVASARAAREAEPVQDRADAA
ncbi:MAG: response regulator [Rhodocyclaceae bacterium]